MEGAREGGTEEASGRKVGSPRAQAMEPEPFPKPSTLPSGQAWHSHPIDQIPPDSVQSIQHFTLFVHTASIYI